MGRRKPNFGTKIDSSLLGGKRTRDLFIYNLDNSTTAEAVADYINGQDDTINICTDDIVVQSKDDAHTKSFRVTIDSNSFDTVNSNDFWPSTIAYRPFFHKRTQRQAETTSSKS